jgi:hypothetical protein
MHLRLLTRLPTAPLFNPRGKETRFITEKPSGLGGILRMGIDKVLEHQF